MALIVASGQRPAASGQRLTLSRRTVSAFRSVWLIICSRSYLSHYTVSAFGRWCLGVAVITYFIGLFLLLAGGVWLVSVAVATYPVRVVLT